MQLTALDQVMAEWALSSKNWPDSALISVLIDWYPRAKTRGLKDFSKQWDIRKQQLERKRETLLAELTAAYAEPHRHYHTLAHIADCLAELAGAWQYAINLNEVRWALLFHDAIYDPRRQDNESRSADWACRVLDELQRPEDEKARVRGMILATAHANEPRTPDEALVLDIDLSIFGADAAKFDDYDRAIRAEYEWVPEADYSKARAEILETFLKRERIYHTAFFRRRYEAAARANLQRALERLRASSLK
jgi:predicted metal-dependent HD superfamily phosphohydrolase